jgi:hypothetical protein
VGCFIFQLMDIGYVNYDIHICIIWIMYLNACIFSGCNRLLPQPI